MLATSILLIVFLMLSGFFSGSETSLFSLGSIEIKSFSTSKDPSEKRVAQLLKEPRKLLLTILIGNMFVNICSSSLSETLFTRLFGPAGLSVSVFIMTILILIFGEVTPKTIAVKYPKYVSRKVAPLVIIVMKVLYPAREFFGAIADRLIRLLGMGKKQNIAPTPEEIKTAVSIARSEHVLHPFEARVIDGILNLKGKTIENIMRPRNTMIALDSSLTIADCIPVLKKKRYSRIPVYKGDLDHIEGMLYVKDLVTSMYPPETVLSSLPYLRKPLFVPEVLSVINLFTMFKKQQVHVAITLDEYGGVSGIVSYEDIFEEIIGEVRDKEDRIPEFRKIGKNMYEIQAYMELRQFNELCKTDFQDANANTIGGFIVNKIGRIPQSGDAYRYGSVLFKVMSAKKNKIDKLMVSILPVRKKQ